MDLMQPSSISPFIFCFKRFLPWVPVSVLNVMGYKYFSFWERWVGIFKIFGIACFGLCLRSFDFVFKASLTFAAVSAKEPRVHSKGKFPALRQTPTSFGLTSAKNHRLLL